MSDCAFVHPHLQIFYPQMYRLYIFQPPQLWDIRKWNEVDQTQQILIDISKQNKYTFQQKWKFSVEFNEVKLHF